MELSVLQQQIAAVEAAARGTTVKPAVVVHELDRLAEHLVGETAPEAQGIKKRVQRLITQVAPDRGDAATYVDAYCNGARW